MKKPSSRKSGHENLSHPSMKTGQKKPENPFRGMENTNRKKKKNRKPDWHEPAATRKKSAERKKGKGNAEKKRRGRPDGKPYRPLRLIPFPRHAAARKNAAST